MADLSFIIGKFSHIIKSNSHKPTVSHMPGNILTLPLDTHVSAY